MHLTPTHTFFCLCPTTTHSWTTMECSQPAGWTTKLSIFMASRVKAFSGKTIHSHLTLPRAAHLIGGATGCHQCLHLALGKYSGISRHATNHCRLSPTCLSTTTFIPAPTQPTIAVTNYTHAPSMFHSSAFHTQLVRF